MWILKHPSICEFSCSTFLLVSLWDGWNTDLNFKNVSFQLLEFFLFIFDLSSLVSLVSIFIQDRMYIHISICSYGTFFLSKKAFRIYISSSCYHSQNTSWVEQMNRLEASICPSFFVWMIHVGDFYFLLFELQIPHKHHRTLNKQCIFIIIILLALI